MADEERLGEVTHFYDRICVAIVQLSGNLSIGDELHFIGPNIDFQQTLLSMQIEHKPIEEAEQGQEVAIKVDQPVKRGTLLFKS
jgi:putative protease